MKKLTSIIIDVILVILTFLIIIIFSYITLGEYL